MLPEELDLATRELCDLVRRGPVPSGSDPTPAAARLSMIKDKLLLEIIRAGL